MKNYTIEEFKEIATLKDGILWLETDENVRIKNGDVKISVGIKSEKYVTLRLDGDGSAYIHKYGRAEVGRDGLAEVRQHGDAIVIRDGAAIVRGDGSAKVCRDGTAYVGRDGGAYVDGYGLPYVGGKSFSEANINIIF